MRAHASRRTTIAAALILGCLICAAPAAAQLSQNMQDMLRRISSGEFGGGGRGAGSGGRWVEGGQGYTTTEQNPNGGVEIVRYDTATPRRDVLMTTAQLTPPQLGKPLQFSDSTSSADGKRVLFATNGRPTMIRKTAYDYWVLDRADNSWYRLGGNTTTGLLYARLSPDGTRAAYVRENDLYVYGWSGGGSMTLNLMFRSPELYKVGVAGAPVPDQTLYDSIYQERYMGLPQENAAGYKAGSPITFAEGLQGKLLIIHGTGDDNVYSQGTQRLLNRLIELNKQFSLMEYPNRRHGISGIHLDTLRYGFLEQYLPAGGR